MTGGAAGPVARAVERVAAPAIGYGIAAGAWAVHLTIYPTFLAYTIALAPGARALGEFLEIEGEAFAHSFGDQMALAERRAAGRRGGTA